jgi:hypothetical protein
MSGSIILFLWSERKNSSFIISQTSESLMRKVFYFILV